MHEYILLHPLTKYVLNLHDTGSSYLFDIINEEVVSSIPEFKEDDIRAIDFDAHIHLMYNSRNPSLGLRLRKFANSFSSWDIIKPSTVYTIFENPYLPPDFFGKNEKEELDEFKRYTDELLHHKEILVEFLPCITLNERPHLMSLDTANKFTKELILYLLFR